MPEARVSEANRTSHCTARSNPPPNAGPLTAATSGFEKYCIRSVNRRALSIEAAVENCEVMSVPVSNSERSKPAQKAGPAPVRTATLTASSASRFSRRSAILPRSAALNALRFSGRFSVTSETLPVRSIVRMSVLTGPIMAPSAWCENQRFPGEGSPR